jgi:hypothetical protein
LADYKIVEHHLKISLSLLKETALFFKWSKFVIATLEFLLRRGWVVFVLALLVPPYSWIRLLLAAE